MRVVIQRVAYASVQIEEKLHAKIGPGLLILLGVEANDTEEDGSYLANKIANMRIFNDSEGKMNISVQDIEGECMVISQFTLHASTDKGNRPSFIKAARPEQAIPLYEKFIQQLQALLHKRVMSGKFGADMKLELLNDGPVTILIDTKNK